jgi:hypothetical protein
MNPSGLDRSVPSSPLSPPRPVSIDTPKFLTHTDTFDKLGLVKLYQLTNLCIYAVLRHNVAIQGKQCKLSGCALMLERQEQVFSAHRFTVTTVLLGSNNNYELILVLLSFSSLAMHNTMYIGEAYVTINPLFLSTEDKRHSGASKQPDLITEINRCRPHSQIIAF